MVLERFVQAPMEKPETLPKRTSGSFRVPQQWPAVGQRHHQDSGETVKAAAFYRKALYKMKYEKTGQGVCVVCGLAIVMGNLHHADCRPKVEICSPQAIHHPDLPERDPGAPTSYRMKLVTSASSDGFGDTGFIPKR